MQPIVLLAIVGIAGGAMSVGFLGNTISLDVQQIGVGETDLASPIDQAKIDFSIMRASGAVNGATETHNVIAKCHITPDKEIAKLSTIFCKLTDIDGNVVAEGQKELTTHLAPGSTIWVTVDPNDFPANRVQNVHDVTLVVLGP